MGVWNDGIAPRLTWAQLKALNPADYNPTKLFYVEPFQSGMIGSYWYSNGTIWCPINGEAVIGRVVTDITMAVNSTNQLLVGPWKIPAGLIADNRELSIMFGGEHLGGTADTCTLRMYFGTNGTSSDTLCVSGAMGTTAVNIGTFHKLVRTSSTQIRKAGSGGVGSAISFAATSTTARPAALTVPNLDTTDSYFTMYGQMTTGTTEYGNIHYVNLMIAGG